MARVRLRSAGAHVKSRPWPAAAIKRMPFMREAAVAERAYVARILRFAQRGGA